VPRYEALYRERAYLGRDVVAPVQHAVADLARAEGLDRKRENPEKKRLPVVQRRGQLSLPFVS
jgi:hypothetical protein